MTPNYLDHFVGSCELLHNLERWCLWLVDLDPADINRSETLKARLAAVAAFRQKSKSGKYQGNGYNSALVP